MSWSWYLANDMCFFIIGLAILYIYLRNKYVKMFVCSLQVL